MWYHFSMSQRNRTLDIFAAACLIIVGSALVGISYQVYRLKSFSQHGFASERDVPSNCARADVNQNGIVTNSDYQLVQKKINTGCEDGVCPEDVNHDRKINTTDEKIVEDCRGTGF